MKTEAMDLPWFRVERIGPTGKVCELFMCIPAQPATHKVTFHDTQADVLICDHHALGIVALGEYVNHRTIELEPFDSSNT